MTVYEWVRAQGTRDVIAVRGDHSGTVTTPIGAPKAQEFRTKDGKKIARGVKLYPVGTGILKREIRARVLQPLVSAEQVAAAGYPANYFHVYEVSEDYCRQVTSEVEVESVDPRTKQARVVWHKTGRNEALDCAVYAFAVYHQLGANRWTERQWDERAAELAAAAGAVRPPDVEEAPAAPPPAAPAAAAEEPRWSFWDGPQR
jgi:phage terminase large subunit GpA-like protein